MRYMEALIYKKDKEIIERNKIKTNLQSRIDALDGNLEIGRRYRIKQIKRNGRPREWLLEVEGILKEKYEDYYVFKDYRGFIECFLKVDFAIGEYQIKEVR